MAASASDESARRDAEAAVRMQGFYSRLESLLKRHQPMDYAPFASAALKAALAAPDRSAPVAAHHVLHSIEANCRYTRGQNHDPVDRNRFIQVLNVYAEHADPLHPGLISQSISHFFLVVHREQIELQHAHARGDLVRDFQLFIANSQLPQLSNDFLQQNGLTIEEWFKLSLLTWIAAERDPRCCFTKETVLDAELVGVPLHRAERFFNASSRTPITIAERFRETRENLKPQFHSLIRSVFWRLRLSTSVVAECLHRIRALSCVTPATVSIACFGFCRTLTASSATVLSGTLEPWFAASKELVDAWISESWKISRRERVVTFFLELPDSVLLLEAKAATFTANLLTENAIRGDNSTAKVAKAIEQLYTTAHEIREGTLQTLGIATTKPIVGIVVTYGDLPLANSRWYFDSFFLKRAETKLKPPIYPGNAMARLPIIMPIHVLELLAATITHLDASPIVLFDEKESRPFLEVGDWNTFLAAKLRESNKKDLMLPFAKEQFVEFSVSLGFERDRAGTI